MRREQRGNIGERNVTGLRWRKGEEKKKVNEEKRFKSKERRRVMRIKSN